MTRTEVEVAIVGAGFAGLCAAIRLRQTGHDDFVVLEAGSGIGGTWRDNTYPGAACDVPSFLYSFSFATWPGWSSLFGRQEEILAYMEHCVDAFGVRGHIRTGQRVERAVFDAVTGTWTLSTGDGGTVRARCIVLGTGLLNRAVWPDLPGIDDFAGPLFHSSSWDHGVDLRGKRVAVIGTGASAIQVVPAIAPVAGHVDLYQRTPAWIVPRPDREIGPGEKALYRRAPALQRAQRQLLYWVLEARGMGFVHPRLLRVLDLQARRHLRRQVSDAALRERLTPAYAIGCKRILLSDDFYPALQRDDVTLAGSAAAFTPDGVVDSEGTHRPADVVALCTGFDPRAGHAPFPIVGLGGRDLVELWEGGAEAYQGTTVAGFPNLFLMTGPNTGLGHSSMVFIIETQVAYTLRCLDRLRDRGLRWLDVRPDAQDHYNRWVRRRMERTVWASGCQSWYLDADGRNSTLYPGLTVDFWWRLRRPRFRDYAQVS